MLRKMLTLGALALVALAFGVGTAAANPSHMPSHGHSGDGFSDGRFG
jgi:Spy/CpxP family protein refolding chaperone